MTELQRQKSIALLEAKRLTLAALVVVVLIVIFVLDLIPELPN